jgi:hypothetical protein
VTSFHRILIGVKKSLILIRYLQKCASQTQHAKMCLIGKWLSVVRPVLAGSGHNPLLLPGVLSEKKVKR